MPPLRSDRASKACESCRRLKTRCYPPKRAASGCLRCETQTQECSLKKTSTRSTHVRTSIPVAQSSDGNSAAAPPSGVEDRLTRLETAVHTLVDRLDTLIRRAPNLTLSRETSTVETPSPTSPDAHDAPVLMIRGIVEDVFANRQNSADAPDEEADPISTGFIQIEDGYELLSLFRLHYGRWINFDQEISLEQLMTRVRTSPLLVYTICLVAARHIRLQRMNSLAPTFFCRARRLLQNLLLKAPQPLEFYQAALILSLWSTTIGQVPLSIDSWLLTSYALQHETASSIATTPRESSTDNDRLSACCTWNHICLAHLQYCVGTGRKPLLHEAQIHRCEDILKFKLSQFEVRMMAELKLYWIIVTRCCTSSINITNTRTALLSWRKEWSFLFDEPRSQFLEMGHQFALLLAYCRLVRSQPSQMNRSTLHEMVRLARDIIDLAMSHTDERTPHLTDHIYHMITFSAITFCRLVTKYPNALAEQRRTDVLESVVPDLIEWLRSIGSTTHISRILAEIIAAHYLNCKAGGNPRPVHSVDMRMTSGMHVAPTPSIDLPRAANLQIDSEDSIVDYFVQDSAWASFTDFSIENIAWLQSNDLVW